MGHGSGNNECYFAARSVGKVGGDIGRCATTNLLMQLGEFTAHCNPTLGPHRRTKVSESCSNAVGTLEEHHRSLFPSQLREVAHATLTRNKALKCKSVCRQAAHGERGQHGTRSWNSRHRDTGSNRGLYEYKTRITDGRHARIGEYEHVGLICQSHELC